MDDEGFAQWYIQWCEEIWRDITWNYEIILINEVKITKYPYKWIITFEITKYSFKWV